MKPKHLYIIALFLLPVFIAHAKSSNTPSFFIPQNAFEKQTRDTPVVLTNIPISTQKIKATVKYPPAPIKEIAQINNLTDDYLKSIQKSYTFSPSQLQLLTDKEFAAINEDTLYLRRLKLDLPQKSKTYRFLNYMLSEQIGQEIVNSRKVLKHTKENYDKLFNEIKPTDKIYLIEAYDTQLLFENYYKQHLDEHKSSFTLKGLLHNISCISLFDNNKKHLFTYTKKHTDMLKDQHFNINSSAKTPIDKLYQNLFDDYLTDLRKIGFGLDINNPNLLRQLNDMSDIVLYLP